MIYLFIIYNSFETSNFVGNFMNKIIIKVVHRVGITYVLAITQANIKLNQSKTAIITYINTNIES